MLSGQAEHWRWPARGGTESLDAVGGLPQSRGYSSEAGGRELEAALEPREGSETDSEGQGRKPYLEITGALTAALVAV